MQYRLIAFDFDGTLADSLASFVACLGVAAQRHGFRRIEDDMVDTLRGLSGRELMRHLGVPLWKVPAITSDMRREMTAHVGEVDLFAGIAPALAALRDRGMPLAIATSNSRANVDAVLGSQVSAHIAYFSCGISLFGKSRRLRALARHCGLDPAQLLYIGDEIRDAEAARTAGVAFRGVGWGYTRPEVLQRHCDQPLLQHPDQLLALLPPAAVG